MPENEDFGMDILNHYGVLTYIDDNGEVHEEKVNGGALMDLNIYNIHYVVGLFGKVLQNART